MARLQPKQEKFCQLYIELGNASEAYRQAYSCGKMKDETINNKAYILRKKGEIRARISELQAEHKERHNLTVDDLIDELEEARQLAKESENASAMVSATMGKAKILGFDKQVVELSGKDGKPIETINKNISTENYLEAREKILNDY
ncbi:terminase small subunit [Acinetobacter corruptisaponis]|uniref:Terminase small subunit n=1 Tax=Acinetobacter corruptisaponis TaxID=3045147 RepID=A0ABY8S7T4_9GAMM|nr:terminase small subunit [Acinetobacter sp. KCTC 92772]WHP06773.1 terminase small subunit [Acinetobacter sp. KCTC 92772]